eukprot:158698-Rhodomonas_salina.1
MLLRACCPLRSTEVGYAATRVLCDIRYWNWDMMLRSSYAMPGTERGRAGTRSSQLCSTSFSRSSASGES